MFRGRAVSVTYKIDARHDVVYTTLRGRVSFAEFTGYLQRLAADPAFHSDMRELLDAGDAVTEEFGVEQMMSFRDSHVWGSEARRAFVCHNDLAFGLFRMFQITSAGVHGHIEIFRDIEEARRWLGLG